MDAVAIYIRGVRKGRGFTQESLVEAVNEGSDDPISKRTIERLERNEGGVAYETVQRILEVIQTNPTHVDYLHKAKVATVEELERLKGYAVQLAERWVKGEDILTREETEIAAAIAASVQPDKIRRARDLISSLLQSNPEKLDRLIGYGERLREE